MFKYKPDNKDAPWYPSLSHKYNAKVPLGHVYTDGPVTTEDVTMYYFSSPFYASFLRRTNCRVNHPYRYEITHYSPPPDIYKPCTPLVPRSFEDTPFTWVNTPAAFQAMLDKLKVAHEIAVDLEHHSYRSYSGFLCLMQISNRDEDWVVDLLTVREEVEALNEVFTDPSIVKVQLPCINIQFACVLTQFRCFTVPKVILSGFSKTLMSMSLACLIHFMPRKL